MTKIFLGYDFYKDGRVFKNGKEVNYYKKVARGKTYLMVRLNGKRYALASLLCELFNGKKYNHLIFIDKNTLNCNVNNLIFVSAKYYKQYSNWHNPNGVKKKQYCQTKATLLAKDKTLREYYLTKDLRLIYKSWDSFKRSIIIDFHDDVFDYFLERCLRNSILGDPKGLMLMYQKTFFNKTQYFDNNNYERNSL